LRKEENFGRKNGAHYYHVMKINITENLASFEFFYYYLLFLLVSLLFFIFVKTAQSSLIGLACLAFHCECCSLFFLQKKAAKNEEEEANRKK
jgi:hypothetical protein